MTNAPHRTAVRAKAAPPHGAQGASSRSKSRDDDRSFAAALARDAVRPGLRKGERSRRAIKAATASLLASSGYGELRVTDIVERAGISNALFYVYYKHKEEVTDEILSEFLRTLHPHPRSVPAETRGRRSEAIFVSHLLYVRQFRANSGLMRCLLQFGDKVESFAALWREFNDGWVDRTLRSLVDQPGLVVRGDDELLLVCASLGSLVDGFLRLAFVDRVARFYTDASGLIADDVALALMLTRLWHRALYAAELDWEPAPADVERLLARYVHAEVPTMVVG